jgi:hypothetical protein
MWDLNYEWTMPFCIQEDILSEFSWRMATGNKWLQFSWALLITIKQHILFRFFLQNIGIGALM